MRIGVMSDCHLGVRRFRKVSNFQNTYEIINYKAFKEAIDILTQQNVDIIIISGDLFETPNPNVKSIMVANTLSEINIPVYILNGNHDYSQRNHVIDCHPFHLLSGKNLNFIIDKPKIFDFNDCDITMIPYKTLTKETFKEVYKGKLRDKTKNSILVIHGTVDLNNLNEESEYYLPKEVAKNYNLVIAGHVHLPQIIKTESTSILVPGSLMPSSQANNKSLRPSVYIYNTSTHEIEAINLKSSPNIHEIITDDINHCLKEISENNFNNDIYFIRYNGKIKDIDESFYRRAIQNVLNLSIQTNETIENVSVNKISEFWNFIEESYPEYYDEFKNFLKGE